jgi:hypothetical protein
METVLQMIKSDRPPSLDLKINLKKGAKMTKHLRVIYPKQNDLLGLKYLPKFPDQRLNSAINVA